MICDVGLPSIPHGVTLSFARSGRCDPIPSCLRPRAGANERYKSELCCAAGFTAGADNYTMAKRAGAVSLWDVTVVHYSLTLK